MRHAGTAVASKPKPLAVGAAGAHRLAHGGEFVAVGRRRVGSIGEYGGDATHGPIHTRLRRLGANKSWRGSDGAGGRFSDRFERTRADVQACYSRAMPKKPPLADRITRFAPSPTGYLHLGHALAALFAARAAKQAGGRFLLRIEDIDATRCRQAFEKAIHEDLRWLGLEWETPVRRQSEHMDDYAGALEKLAALEVLYPCFCTRKEIRAEIAAAGNAPHGPDGPLYPGTCREIEPRTRKERMKTGLPYALRLDLAKAAALTGGLYWTDAEAGTVAARPQLFGDVVLARRDTPTSYHLSVVVDDADQGITLVTRGKDLFHATHIQRLLQALLGFDTPDYYHHKLITDEDGNRLATRDDARSILTLREDGVTPGDLRARLGFD